MEVKLPDIECNSVLGVYSEIAAQFNRTRPNPWPYVHNYHHMIPEGGTCLDIGCGGGRDITDTVSQDRRLNWYAIDTCPEFVDITRTKMCNIYGITNEEVIQRIQVADMSSLPFTYHLFDAIQVVASFHHLSTVDRRVQALREMWRVLIPGGQIQISVWSANRLVNNKQVESLLLGDNIIPWGSQKLPRYYYIFSEPELVALIMDSCPGADIIDNFWEHGNIVIRFKKPL